MCDSLGKKNFSKKGLAAICIYENLSQLDEAGPDVTEKVKALVQDSELLKLSRTELETLAAESKGPNVNWGSYSRFASGQI
jgi:hypothetical protein